MPTSLSADATLPSQRIPSVVVIAPAKELLDALRKVVRYMDEAPTVKAVDLKDAATTVAAWRPFAVIVAEDLLAFDPEEFHALARDVGAEVMAYRADARMYDLATLLLPELQAAILRWTTSEFAGH